MGRPVGLIAPVLLSLLAGCATAALDMAPDRPDAPWTAATGPNGEIVAGERVPADEPRNPSYVLPSNQLLANIPPPASRSRAAPPLFPAGTDRYRAVQ